MPSKKNRASDNENGGSGLADLISDIRRSERTLAAAIQRRTGKPSPDRWTTTGDCRTAPGGSRRENSPLCPECVYEQGYLDQTALAKNLAFLQGKTNDKLCECGIAKITWEITCKRCAIQSERRKAMIKPREVPCPDCGDGRKPQYSYCTDCPKARKLLNSDGTIDAMCPTNRCSCGLTKEIAYSRCTICETNLREEISEIPAKTETEIRECYAGTVNAAKRL